MIVMGESGLVGRTGDVKSMKVTLAVVVGRLSELWESTPTLVIEVDEDDEVGVNNDEDVDDFELDNAFAAGFVVGVSKNEETNDAVVEEEEEEEEADSLIQEINRASGEAGGKEGGGGGVSNGSTGKPDG